MKKHVYLDKTGKGKLQQVFSCTDVMVWKALTFESDSELARKIRHTAIKEFGGMLMGDGVCTGFETTHETEGTMTQTFSNRVKIVVYKKEARAAVLIDGEVKMIEEELTIPVLMNLQQNVLQIARNLQL
jgi:hypothetical protein